MINQFTFNKYLQSNSLIKSFQIILIIIFLNGLISSHQAINLSKSQKSEIQKLAKKQIFSLLGKFMGQYDLLSLYWTHGTKEWEAIENKECFYDRKDLEGKLIFLYSHREFFEKNSNHMKNLSNAEYPFPKILRLYIVKKTDIKLNY